MLFHFFNSLSGWQDEQRDLLPFGFALHFVHHGQGASSSSNDQTTAFPWNLLFNRYRRVPELVAKFLRWLLLTLTYVSAVDHHVVLIGHAVDSDRTKGKLLETHFLTSEIATICMRARR